MAFDKSNSKGKPAAEKKDKRYRKIGSMWKSKNFNGHNMSIDDYAGDLIFRDKETGEFYKVKGASLFDPKENAPENLVFNMVIDLNNTYDVAPLDEGGAESEQQEEPSPQQNNSFGKRRG